MLVSLMFNDSKLVHAQKKKESILESLVFETFNVLRLTNRLKVSGSASKGHCETFNHSNWVKIPKKIGSDSIRLFSKFRVFKKENVVMCSSSSLITLKERSR